MMAVTHHQGTIGALHNDQMHAVVELILLLDLKTLPQTRQGWAIRIAAIAMQAEITHDGGRQAPTGISQAQHMQFAKRYLTAREDIGEKCCDIRPRTDHDVWGVENALSRINLPRGNAVHGTAPEEMHAKRLFKPGCKARNGFSAFDPKLMRAVQCSKEVRGAEWRGDVAPFQQTARCTHRARQEFAQHVDSLGPPDCHEQAAMMDRDTSEWGNLGPKIT